SSLSASRARRSPRRRSATSRSPRTRRRRDRWTTMPDTATMLQEVGGSIPTAKDLDYAHVNTSAVELLVMSLNRGGSDLVLTAEEAWHLTDFARGVRMTAESLTEWANEIESDVETIYANNRPLGGAGGGDDA